MYCMKLVDFVYSSAYLLKISTKTDKLMDLKL